MLSTPRLYPATTAQLPTRVSGEPQLFATTHSGECVAAACDAFADRADEIAVHVLHRADDDRRVHAATYTGETLQAARDLDLDVR